MSLSDQSNPDLSKQSSYCIICNTRFKAPLKIHLSHNDTNQKSKKSESNSNSNPNSENGDDQILVKFLQEMCTIFSKYFNVTPSILSAKSWDFSTEVFPFCHKCRDIVAELSILHNEIESVRRKINKLIASTSITIINSFSLNEDSTQNPDNCYRKISRVRKSIYKQLNPSLILTDIKNKQKNPVQQDEIRIPSCNSDQNFNSKEVIEIPPIDLENSPILAITADNSHTQTLNEEDTGSNLNQNVGSPLEDKCAVSDDDDDFVGENDDYLITSDIEEQEEEDKKPITIDSDDVEVEREKSSNPSSPETNSTPRQPSIMERLRSRIPKVTTTETIELENDDEDDSLSSSSTSSTNSTDSEDESANGRERINLTEVTKIGYRKFSVRGNWIFTKNNHKGNSKHYKCGQCGQPEKTKKLILNHILGWHIKSHAEENSEVLKENPKTKEYVYKEKYPFSRGESKFHCGLCKITCTKKLTMIRHMQKKHFPEARNFECDTCFRTFSSQAGLKQHDCSKPARFQRITTIKCGNGKFLYRGEFPFFKLDDGQGYKCGSPGCDHVCKNRLRSMNDHIRRVHADKTRFVCEKCGKNCCSPHEFRIHSFTHSDVKSVQCDECGKRIKTLALLKLHQKLHREDYPFKCDAEGCDSKFKLKASLQIHVIRHHPQEDEKAAWKFNCTICGENLKSERKLEIHTKEHQVKKSAECPTCHKKFWGNTQLNIHLNRHKKVLKFFCKTCNKGFLQKWQLTRHYQSKQHEERLVEVGGNSNNNNNNNPTDDAGTGTGNGHDDNLTKKSGQVNKKRKRQVTQEEEEEDEESDNEQEEEETTEESEESEAE